MKRFLLSIVMPIFSALCLNAQTTISTGSSAIDVSVKRAVAVGNDVNIDFIITGRNNWTLLYFLEGYINLFDDEGNLYEGGLKNSGYRILFEWDGNRSSRCTMKIEKDIPRKLRIIVKDVDEYANTFLLMKIRYYGNSTSNNDCLMTIKNLPISR